MNSVWHIIISNDSNFATGYISKIHQKLKYHMKGSGKYTYLIAQTLKEKTHNARFAESFM